MTFTVFKNKQFELIKIEVIFSLLFLFLFLSSQLYNNYFSLNEVILLITLFLNYFFFTFIQSKYENILLRLLNIFFLIFFIFRLSILPIDTVRINSIFFSEYINIANLNIFKYVNLESITKYLIYLNLNYFIFGILLSFIRPKKFELNFEYIKPKYINLFLIIVISQILLIFIYYLIFPLGLLPEKNIAILKIFFHLFNLDKIYILMVFLILVISKFEYQKKLVTSVFLVTIISIVFASLFFYSKSSLLEVTLYFGIMYFLIDKRFIINSKYFKYLIVYIFAFFIMYFISKFLRVIFLTDSLSTFFFSNHLSTIPRLIFVIFERLGFIDYYLFVAANDNILKDLFVFENYYKIIIDKLTPFFDIYNSSLLSRQIYTTLYQTSQTVTQSYQITIFGEMYLLFGYFSFIFYFIFSLILKFLLDYLSKLNISNNIKIILIFFVLKSYFFYLIGYGLDTFIINIVYDCTFIFLITFAFYIFKKFKKNEI